MLNEYGYFNVRDVYPMNLAGLSTREKTKLNSTEIDTTMEITETKEQINIESSDKTNVIKFIAISILILFLVNRFGK